MTAWGWLRRFDWDRAQVFVVAAFHLLIGFTLLFAPRVQVITVGTQPVFDLAPPTAWAVLFFAAGAAAACLFARVTLARQIITWMTVFPLGFSWSGAFAAAVLEGRGSAITAIVWPALLAAWAISAVRIALHSDLTGR